MIPEVNIGIDFGTTNSSIGFINVEGLAEVFKDTTGGSSGSIPSYVSYSELNSVEKSKCFNYGTAAKVQSLLNEFYVFSKFKLLLGANEESSHFLGQHGYTLHALPSNVTRDYLCALIHDYISTKSISTTALLNVVITIPETWLQSANYLAREQLISIINKLEVSLFSVVSEPVAASAYYLYLYEKSFLKKYKGSIIVCDYGGGTLDLSLVKVNKNNVIDYLAGTGIPTSDSPYGYAGVGYDKAVLKTLFGESALQNDRLFIDFEMKKLAFSPYINKSLKEYLDRGDAKLLFEFEGVEITSNLLVKVYQEYIEPHFIEQLQILKRLSVENGVDVNNTNTFKVLMVGGFTNYYLVQRTLNEFFGIEENRAIRDVNFNIEETIYAVSKGAALIASEKFVVTNRCPITLGVKGRKKGLNTFEYLPVLTKGTSLADCNEKIFWYPEVFIVGSFDHDNSRLCIYLEKNEGIIVEYPLASLQKVLPNPDPLNEWRIGFSGDSNQIFKIHIIDKNKEQKTIHLGELTKDNTLPPILAS